MIKENATELPKPKDVEGKTIKDGIELSWRYDEPYTRGFYVYRATALDEKFNQVSNLIPADGSNTYAYKDLGEHLKAGEMYRYAIRAENDAYLLGKLSDTIHAFPGIKTKIESPKKLSSIFRDSVVELYWEDLTEREPNLLGYKVFRNDGLGGTMHLMPNDTLSSYKNFYNDREIVGGRTYIYHVTAIDFFGTESNRSLSTTITVPVKETNISSPNKPLVFKNSNGVRISWDQQGSDNNTSIKIYRSDPNTATKEITIISIDEYNFLDTSVEKNGLYYYKISFINNEGKESSTSVETSINF